MEEYVSVSVTFPPDLLLFIFRFKLISIFFVVSLTFCLTYFALCAANSTCELDLSFSRKSLIRFFFSFKQTKRNNDAGQKAVTSFDLTYKSLSQVCKNLFLFITRNRPCLFSRIKSLRFLLQIHIT